jgi:hypothetical protein
MAAESMAAESMAAESMATDKTRRLRVYSRVADRRASINAPRVNSVDAVRRESDAVRQLNPERGAPERIRCGTARTTQARV